VLRADSAMSSDRTVVGGPWSPLAAIRGSGGSTQPRIRPEFVRLWRKLAANGNRTEEPVRLEASRVIDGLARLPGLLR
jgi:hypothetical protein